MVYFENNGGVSENINHLILSFLTSVILSVF